MQCDIDISMILCSRLSRRLILCLSKRRQCLFDGVEIVARYECRRVESRGGVTFRLWSSHPVSLHSFVLGMVFVPQRCMNSPHRSMRNKGKTPSTYIPLKSIGFHPPVALSVLFQLPSSSSSLPLPLAKTSRSSVFEGFFPCMSM